MNHIELGAPACLPLGIVKTNRNGTERTCLFGAALQHPTMHIYAQRTEEFVVTGARADVAIPYVERYCNANNLLQPSEIEIDLAIPAHVGLGSEPMLGMAMAKAVAWLNTHDQAEPKFNDPGFLTSGLGIDGAEALYQQAALQGGMLLVDPTAENDEQAVVHRYEPDMSEKNAWAFVLVIPRVPADTPVSFEKDRLNALLNAASHLDTQSGDLFYETLAPAIEQDDLDAFGAGLMQLQTRNQAALEAAGHAILPTEWEESVFNIMSQNGAVAWGRSPTGYGLFALARGARSTINLRAALRSVVPHDRANMIATVVDGEGMRVTVKDGKIKLLV